MHCKNVSVEEITYELRTELESAEVVIPDTNGDYVLLSRHIYEKMRKQLNEIERLQHHLLSDLRNVKLSLHLVCLETETPIHFTR